MGAGASIGLEANGDIPESVGREQILKGLATAKDVTNFFERGESAV
jgi:hypothetical protein